MINDMNKIKYVHFKSTRAPIISSYDQFIVQIHSKRYWLISDKNPPLLKNFGHYFVGTDDINRWVNDDKYEIIKEYDTDDEFLKDWFHMLVAL